MLSPHTDFCMQLEQLFGVISSLPLWKAVNFNLEGALLLWQLIEIYCPLTYRAKSVARSLLKHLSWISALIPQTPLKISAPWAMPWLHVHPHYMHLCEQHAVAKGSPWHLRKDSEDNTTLTEGCKTIDVTICTYYLLQGYQRKKAM